MKLEPNFAKVLMLIAVITAIATPITTIELRFAKQTFAEEIASRLDIKILEDQVFFIQQQIWTLEGQFGPGCEKCPPAMLNSYRILLNELKNTQATLRAARG